MIGAILEPVRSICDCVSSWLEVEAFIHLLEFKYTFSFSHEVEVAVNRWGMCWGETRIPATRPAAPTREQRCSYRQQDSNFDINIDKT